MQIVVVGLDNWVGLTKETKLVVNNWEISAILMLRWKRFFMILRSEGYTFILCTVLDCGRRCTRYRKKSCAQDLSWRSISFIHINILMPKISGLSHSGVQSVVTS